MAHPILQKYGIQEEEKQHPILQKYGIQEEKQHPILQKYGIAKPVTTPFTAPVRKPSPYDITALTLPKETTSYDIPSYTARAPVSRGATGSFYSPTEEKAFTKSAKEYGLGVKKPREVILRAPVKGEVSTAITPEQEKAIQLQRDIELVKKYPINYYEGTTAPIEAFFQGLAPVKKARPGLVEAHPIAQMAGEFTRDIGLAYMLGGATAPLVPKLSKAIPMVNELYPTLTRVVTRGIQTGIIGTVLGATRETGREITKGEKINLKKIFEEAGWSGLEFVPWGAVGGSKVGQGKFGSLKRALTAGGATGTTTLAIEAIKNNKIGQEEVTKAVTNAMIAALVHGYNGRKIAEAYKHKEIDDFLFDKIYIQVKANHPKMSDNEAKALSTLLKNGITKVDFPPAIIQKFNQLERGFKLELPKEGAETLLKGGRVPMVKVPVTPPVTKPIPVIPPIQPTISVEGIPAVPAVMPKAEAPVVGVKETKVLYHKIGSNNIEIIKNPTSQDLNQITAEFKKDFPQGKREPSIRKTFDNLGNEYIWRSDKATHPDIENFLDKKFGVKTSQNQYIAQEAPAMPKAEAPSSLVEEAKKYKTVEEFVESFQKAFHGTPTELKEIGFGEGVRSRTFMGDTVKVKSGAIFFTPDKSVADFFASNRADFLKDLGKATKPTTYERYLNIKNPLDLTTIKKADKFFYDNKLMGDFGRAINESPIGTQGIKEMIADSGVDIKVTDLWNVFDDKVLTNKIKKLGYDGAILSEAEGRGTSYAIFNPEQAFTKSDLTSIWEQAHKPQQPKAEAPSSLVEEAKKHKTAEEFVGGYTPVFRASDKSFDITLIGEEGMFVSPSENIAGFFGEGGKRPVEKLFISPNAKFLEWKDIPEKLTDFSGKDIKKIHVGIKEYAESKGYDIVSHEPQAGYPKGIELQIINPDVIKTRSDLTSIWEQAHKKVTLPEEQQMGLPITETLPLEERASLLERAGYTEEAEKLRRTAIKTSREITLDIEGKEKQTEFITQQENTMKEVLQSPNKYGISEEQLELFPDEVEVANGSQKIQKTNRIETARDIRNIHSTSPIHHKETSKIAQEIESRGFIDYRGKEVNSPQEIAELATAFRHPKMEQLQVFYLKGKKVVAHRIISSGAPAHVTTDHKLFYKIKNAAGRLGADGIYLAHNHPSGDPTPSKQDIGFTAFMEYNNRLIKGHIVTNSDKYSLIEKSYPEAFKHIERWKATEHTFKETQKDYRRGLTLISTSENVAAQTKDFIQGNKLSIVFMDSQNKIMSIDNIGIDKDIRQYIIEVIRARGAVRYIISHSTAIKPPKVKYPPGILDYVMVDPETGVYSDKSISFPKEISIEQAPPSKGKYYGIQEKPAEYHPEAKEIEPKKLKEKIGQPVKSSAIQKKYEKIEDAWFGNKDVEAVRASVEANKAQEAIRKTTREKRFGQQSKNIDKAIQIYIDLKRNPTHYDKFINELTPEQQRIVNLSQNLSKEQKAIADEISKQYSEVGLKSKEAEVIRNTIDNYVARVWDVAPPKRGTEVGRKFGVTTRHAKARTFETIVEGWANKYTLKIEGATNNLAILKEEMNNVIQDKKFLNLISKLKDVEGNPIISTTQLEGYARVEHPNFKQWKFAGQATPEDLRGRNFFQTPEGTILERKELYAPEKLAQDLNNIMGVSKLKGIKAIDVITKYNAVVKAWVLQTSFFHHVAFMRSFYLGSAPFGEIKIGKGFIESLKDLTPRQSYKTGLEAINNFTPEIELLVKNGLTLGKIQDWEESILRNEDFFIGKMLDKYKATKAIKDKINLFRENQAKFLFQQFGAGLKAKAALIELKNILKKHPNMETNKAAKMAANLTNDDFGGLHLKRLKRNPTVQHIFRIFALAPDWTESNIRSMVKAFKTGQEGKVYRRFWARILTKGILATLIANVLLGGDDWWENYKKAWKSGWNKLRWLDVDITPIYKLFGGETEARKYFSILGHFKDPLKFAIDPIQAAHYKGSMVYGAIFEAITGEDWAGRTFTSLDELVKTGETVKYAPFTAKPQKYTTIPSYTIAQLKGSQPVQFQQLLSWWAGETEGFDSIANSLGFGVRTTYPPKKKKSKYGVQFKKSKKETHPILKKYGIK